jgi:hypothetical protein
MNVRTFLVSILGVSLVGAACTSETPSPAVDPAEAAVDLRLIGIWKLIDEEDDAHLRVAAFDEHQLLVEWVTPTGCGYDCTVEPCQMTCPEDPVFGSVSIQLVRVLVSEFDGARWVSICPIWIAGFVEPTQEGPVSEEDRVWLHGRLSFLPGDTLLLELLADHIEGAEGATTPEAVRALLTQENLSGDECERYRIVLVPRVGETSTFRE